MGHIDSFENIDLIAFAAALRWLAWTAAPLRGGSPFHLVERLIRKAQLVMKPLDHHGAEADFPVPEHPGVLLRQP